MLVNSHLEPDQYKIRKQETGKVFVLLRGNIETKSITNEDGLTETQYEYCEYEIICSPRADLDSYITNNFSVLYEQARDKAREEKCKKVDAKRDKLIAAGLPYDFPDGTSGTIQLRDVIDQRNVQAKGVKGLKLEVRGETKQEPFRDAENQPHFLTPVQLVDMATAVEEWIQNIYIQSWQHKDSIRTSEDFEKLGDWPE